MKKASYMLIGAVVGAALMTSASVAAEEVFSLVGKKVDAQTVVVVDGKELSVPVALIEGTSYAPIRAIGEAVGRDVDWKEGKVVLNAKHVSESEMDYTNPGKYPRIAVEYRISVLQVYIVAKKSNVEQGKDVTESQRLVEQYEAELAVWQARLEEIEAEEAVASSQQ